MSILDDVAKQAADAIGAANVFYTGTLKTHTRTSDGRGGYTQAETSVSVEYLVEDYSDYMRASGGIPPNDRKAMIVAHGLANPPKPEDKLVLSDREWTIISTKTDPAKAIYTCQIR